MEKITLSKAQTSATAATLGKDAEIEAAGEYMCRALLSRLDKPEFAHFGSSPSHAGVHLSSYVKHVVRSARPTPATMAVAAVLIDRFLTTWPDARLHMGGPHRVFLTTLMLAAKWHEDSTYTNKTYARIGLFFPMAELNACEVEMLGFLAFDMHVSVDTFESKMAQLHTLAAALAPAPAPTRMEGVSSSSATAQASSSSASCSSSSAPRTLTRAASSGRLGRARPVVPMNAFMKAPQMAAA